ncbi:MAG: NYN domain-containing protein, partial [Patescibacteria group bacterium]|nr:NYN domain-containing protein [Patescibacteria group bacterium]
MPPFLLIDGYNLLHATGLVARGFGPGTLERARLALLNFLAASLDTEQRPRTTIVFDAGTRGPGLPREMVHGGLTVLFAAGYSDADTLIEELIRRHSAPRRLIVVSSDHQVQRAARRRRARAVDSDVWYGELATARQLARDDSAQPDPRPPVPLLQEDVNYWLRQFGGEQAIEAWLNAELTRAPPPLDKVPGHAAAPRDSTPEEAATPGSSGRKSRDREKSGRRRLTGRKRFPVNPPDAGPLDEASGKPLGKEANSLANPFPPGYAE